jgi:hypothetical protein
LRHPVAYIDAWTDDLQDEPLVALAATLEEALKPFRTNRVSKRIEKFNSTAARVARIVATGLVKRGVGMLITEGAATILSDEVAEHIGKIDGAVIKESAEDSVEDVADIVASQSRFRKKILRYKDGRKAVEEMKRNLADIILELDKAAASPPVIIIVDELDRCRPTYAIKLLEEAKHLFDVHGVIFVLGLHQQQLARSIAGAYGSEFDGTAYLRRFVDRQYTLQTPRLGDLIAQSAETFQIDLSRLEAPGVANEGAGVQQLAGLELVTRYAQAVELPARDALRLIESLTICLALTGNEKLYTPYLLPLLISHVSGRHLEAKTFDWYYWVPVGARQGYRPNDQYKSANPVDLFMELETAASKSYRELSSRNSDQQTYAESMVIFKDHGMIPPAYTALRGYKRLVGSVARFSSPITATA